MRRFLEYCKRRLQTPAPSSPTRSVLLLLAVVGIISVVVWLFAASSSVQLVYLTSSSLSSSQLSQASACLDQLGQTYHIKGSYILVEPAHKQDLLARMDFLSDLPQPVSGDYERQAGTSGLFLTETQRQSRSNLKREHDLAAQIRTFKGVRTAAVFLAGSSRQGFGRTRTQPSASVTISTDHDQPIDPLLAQAIRRTLAGAIDSLDPKNVSVIDTGNGQPVPLAFSAQDSANGESAPINLYLPALRRQAETLEAQWEQKIRTKLSYIPKLVISVNINPLSLANSRTLPKDDALNSTSDPDISVAIAVPHSYLLSLYRRQKAPTSPTSQADSTSVQFRSFAAEQITKITAAAAAIIGRPTASYVHADWFYDNPSPLKASAASAEPTATTNSTSLLSRSLEPSFLATALLVATLAASTVLLARKVAQSNRRQRAIALARIGAEKHHLHISPLRELAPGSTIHTEPSIYNAPAALQVSAFEELIELNQATLRGLLRRTEPQIIALALRTAPDKLRHSILAGLSHQRRQIVHDQPDFLGPVRLSDIEAAQQELVDLLDIPGHRTDEPVATVDELPV